MKTLLVLKVFVLIFSSLKGKNYEMKKKIILTPSLYCMGPKVSEPKKWLVPNFIFKGWEWCI